MIKQPLQQPPRGGQPPLQQVPRSGKLPPKVPAAGAAPSTPSVGTDAGAPSAGDQKTYKTMLAGLLAFVWGKGQPDIQRQLQQASKTSLPGIIGHITFALVQQAADQAEAVHKHLSMDMLLGLATEMIETLEKMAAALNMQFDPQNVALQALTQSLNDYAETLPPGSAAQADAQNALKEIGPATVNGALQNVQAIGARNGTPPFKQVGAAPQGVPQGGVPQTGLMGAAS